MSAFASKAASGFQRGLKVARIKSKEAAGTVSIRRRLAGLRKDRSSAVEELGEQVYSMLSDGELVSDGLEPLRQRIDDISRHINELETDLETVHEKASEELE